MKTKTKRGTTSKTKLIKKADVLFSTYWRDKLGHCEKCGRSNMKLELAHIISRDCKKLRWERANTLVLCTGCHFWAHKHPLHFSEFIKTIKGKDTYKWLIVESNNLRPLDIKHYQGIVDELKSYASTK